MRPVLLCSFLALCYANPASAADVFFNSGPTATADGNVSGNVGYTLGPGETFVSLKVEIIDDAGNSLFSDTRKEEPNDDTDRRGKNMRFKWRKPDRDKKYRIRATLTYKKNGLEYNLVVTSAPV